MQYSRRKDVCEPILAADFLPEYKVNVDPTQLDTPCYLIDMGLLRRNLQILGTVQDRTGCKILLALKGFAAWSTFDLCRQYLHGAAASSLHEAKLAAEYFKKEVHLCAPAYRDDDMIEYLQIVDHIVFNSHTQWQRFRQQVQKAFQLDVCQLNAISISLHIDS